MFYGYQNAYGFTKFKTMRALGDPVKNCIIKMDLANDGQNYLTKKVKEFISKTRLFYQALT